MLGFDQAENVPRKGQGKPDGEVILIMQMKRSLSVGILGNLIAENGLNGASLFIIEAAAQQSAVSMIEENGTFFFLDDGGEIGIIESALTARCCQIGEQPTVLIIYRLMIEIDFLR